MKKSMIRFIDCYVPTEVCNMKCPYCYIGQRDGFGGEIHPITHSPGEIRDAISKKRFGGSVFINFCAGGETLLGGDILPVVRALIEEGHFVQIVTNGTIDERYEEIAGWGKEILDSLFVKFSFHYTELKRLGKLDSFFDNILLLRGEGCSVSLEITPGDELIPYIDEMKEISLEKLGALPHVTVARNTTTDGYELLSKLDREEYIHTWQSFASPMFDLKMKLLGEKRHEYCYAGEWTFALHLNTGDLRQCYNGDVIANIYENIDQPIRFRPVGTKCREPYCWNGHAWMTLGCIPNKDIITYADIRNRVAGDKTEWLTPAAKDFLSQKLETHNTVYDNVTPTPKVLLLGDSICMGYRQAVAENLGGRAVVYYPAANAMFSTYLLRFIHTWARDLSIGSNIDIVHFNVGLWDVLRICGDEPLVDIETYGENLCRIIERIKYVFPNARIVFATTTPVLEERQEYDNLRFNADIVQYNTLAYGIMQKNDIIVNDLHKIAAEALQGMYSDGVHFTVEGYARLAGCVTDVLRQVVSVLNDDGSSARLYLKDEEVRANPKVLLQRRIIVYGAGVYGKKVINRLTEQNANIECVLDRNRELWGSLYCEKYPIVSPESYMNKACKPEEDIVIIAVNSRSVVMSLVDKLKNIPGLWICSYDIWEDL